MKIYFLKQLLVLFVLFLKLWWSCLTRELFAGGVNPQWVDVEVLFYFILWL